MGNKEVFTNEKGEYSFTGIKPGGAIEIEKEGYKKELVQVNSNLAADTNLSRKPVVGVTGVDLGKVPAIAEITKNLKLADLKNIFNK